MKKFLLIMIVMCILIQPHAVFAADGDVALVEPGLWGTIKENLGLALAGVGSLFTGFMLFISQIKGGFKSVKDSMSAKADEEAETKTTILQKIENTKNDLLRKGQLEGLVITVESEIISQITRLDVVTEPATRVIIEDRIAVLKTRLAGYESEKTVLNERLPKLA